MYNVSFKMCTFLNSREKNEIRKKMRSENQKKNEILKFTLTSYLCQKFVNSLVAMESKLKWNHNQNMII